MKLIEEIVPVTFGFRTSEPVPGLNHAYVYKSDKGEMVPIKSGELMTNKKGKAHKFNIRYRVNIAQNEELVSFNAPSREKVYDFTIKIKISYSVKNPVTYILANKDPFINELKDTLIRETKKYAREFAMDEFAVFDENLPKYLTKSINLPDLGAEISIHPEVEQDHRYKARIEDDHEIDVNKDKIIKVKNNDEEIKERELASIRKLLANSPLIHLLEFKDDPKEIKQILSDKYMAYLDKHQAEQDQLRSSMINGKIDPLEFKVINESLKEAFYEADIVVINRDLKKLDYQSDHSTSNIEEQEIVIDFQEEEDFLEENEVR